MKIEHIAYFVKTAECRSISSAARKLYVSQSTLSSAISALESELGYPLFHRSAKGIALTEAGERSFELMKDICRKYDALLQMNPSRESEKKQTVCVSVYPCLCSYLSIMLPQSLQSEASWDNMLSVKDGQGVESILDETANIAINHCETDEFAHFKRLLKNSDFTIEELFEDQMCCYVNRNSPLAARDFICASELRDERLVISQCCLKQHSMRLFQAICTHITVLNQPDTIKQAVSDGGVVGIVPGCSLIGKSQADNVPIVRIPIVDMDMQIISFMIHRKKPSEAERIVIRKIREILLLD